MPSVSIRSLAGCITNISWRPPIRDEIFADHSEIWWADLGEPIGSAPGYRRPVLVVQCDAINASRIGTVVCVPLTSNLKWGDAPGNVVLRARMTGLSKDAVANVSLIVALDKQQLTERVGKIPRRQVDLVVTGIDVILGR